MTRPRLTVLVPCVLAVALLAGCSSSSDGGGTTGTPSSAATSATAASSAASSASPSSSAAAVASPSVGPSPVAGASGAVSFAGVTVANPTAVGTAPTITSSSTTPAPGLLVQDLVVGTGAAATSTSTVAVNYAGVLYSDGTAFDSSFTTGQPASFPLTGVVPGFAQGIGGTDGVEPMKTGGRRLLVFPAALGYGNAAQGPIPAGASLVFVIDLLNVS